MWSSIWKFSYVELWMWNQVSYDPRSCESNLCNCVYRRLKMSGLQGGLNVWPRDNGSTLQPTELWRHWCWELVICGLWVLRSPWGMNVKLYMKYFIYWTPDVRMPCWTGFSLSTLFADLVNCLLRGMKGLEAHFIMRGDTQPTFKKARRVPYALQEQVKNELDKL